MIDQLELAHRVRAHTAAWSAHALLVSNVVD